MKRHGLSVRKFSGMFPSTHDRCYVATKLATDPLYSAVYEVIRTNTEPLLDVGCGMGVLAFYLRQRNWLPAITGVDSDTRKIVTACGLAGSFGGNLAFIQGDAGVSLPAHRGSVCVLDILQYFPTEERDAMLRQCAARVTEEGVLVIRSGIRDDSMRFTFTRYTDRIAKWTNWIKATPACYPTRNELLELLGEAGLSGEFEPLWGHTPFNSWLGVFRRTKPS